MARLSARIDTDLRFVRQSMTKRLTLLINPGAGSVPPRPEEGFIERLARAAGWADVEVRLMDGNLEETASQACRDNTDYLAIAGGDGTARSVSQVVAREGTNCSVIPLPLGTANLLPKRLYGERDAETVLHEARGYREVRLHAGELDGELFFVSASVGFVAQFAEAREAVRDKGMFGGLGRLWHHAGAGMKSILSTRLNLYADGEEERYTRTRAVLLAPGGLGAMFEGYGWTPEKPCLEVAAADPRHIREVASLGLDALLQRWRQNARVETRWVERLKVDGREKLDIMLDGETFYRDAPIEFTLRPEAVRFLAAE